VERVVEAALSTWALAWAFSFWYRTDGLRERLGVSFLEDAQGNRVERVDSGGLGAWLNCPLCAAVALLPLGFLLRKALAPLGLALLIVRWWESQRPRAEWWR
jgi:hypothetical protein